MQVHGRDEPVQDPARTRIGISSDPGKGVQANEVENDNMGTQFSTVTSMRAPLNSRNASKMK